MIPQAFITEWKQYAPWENNRLLEQDLIISRLLVEMFSHPILSKKIAFRGGTAFYKLFVKPPLRYSEDIDLVQVEAEPIGETLRLIKEIVNPILGKPKWKLNHGRATLFYKFITEENAQVESKIKIEINTREHYSMFGLMEKEFSVQSRWYEGGAKILTYHFDELMGIKLRALYQRKKSRDLFDIWVALLQSNFDPKRVVDAFQFYMKNKDKIISRAMFEENLFNKMQNDFFVEDISPILSLDAEFNVHEAAKEVREKILALLPGDEWKIKT